MILLQLLFAATLASPAQVAREPNILLIIADDLGKDLVGIYEAHPVPANTPTIDRLAQSGLRFDAAYSDPTCSPSRASLMTGHYGADHLNPSGQSHHIGSPVWWDDSIANPFGGDSIVPICLPFIPALAPDHYKTGMVGKLHWDHIRTGDGSPGNPLNYRSAVEPARGFDRYLGAPAGSLAAHESDLAGFTTYTHVDASASGPTHVTEVEDGQYITSREVDDAFSLMTEFSGSPWFITLAFHAPHRPFHVPPDELHSLGPLTDELNHVLMEPSVFDDDYAAASRPLMRAAAEALDTELLRLFRAMGPSVLNSTVIIFVSDNGTPFQTMSSTDLANYAFTGAKGSVSEGGVRVPLIVNGPGVAAPQVGLNQLVNLQDLHATILDLMGTSQLPGTPSVSLVPYMSNPSLQALRPATYSRSHRKNGPAPGPDNPNAIHAGIKEMARAGRYKLIRRRLSLFGQVQEEFYDVQADPREEDALTPSSPGYSQAAYDFLCPLLELNSPTQPACPPLYPPPARPPPCLFPVPR